MHSDSIEFSTDWSSSLNINLKASRLIISEPTKGEKFFIDLALAGLDIDDVEIEVKEDNLTVRSTWDEAGDYFNGGGEYVHRGISFKKFTRSFILGDDIEVIDANFKNGLLTVALERIIPESKKARKIKINTKKEFLKG